MRVSTPTRTPTPPTPAPICVGLRIFKSERITNSLLYYAATYNQGARVSDYYYTYNGDEETLKTLVARQGE